MMKIGIIGSGISGLSAAFLLGKPGHQVTLFERQPQIGMSGQAFSVGADSFIGTEWIDVPSRLLNALQWPNLMALYQGAGIETESVSAGQSYSGANGALYLQFDPEDLFANNPLSVLMSRLPKLFFEMKQLRQAAEIDLAGGIDEGLSIDQYLGGYSDALKSGFLYPLLSSTICTCSFDAIKKYPASFILSILSHLDHSPSQPDSKLLRTRFGTADVVDKLLVHTPELCLGADVKCIGMNDRCVRVDYVNSQTDLQESREFDHVIIATQANHAWPMVPDEGGEVPGALRRFAYEDVDVVLHHDEQLLPEKSSTWSTFNFKVNSVPNRASNSMCNIWLNRFYGCAEQGKNWFQAINPIEDPDPRQVLSRARLQRPVVSSQSFSAWEALEGVHNQAGRRIWFAGSYASSGVPLLESGVVSVQNVVTRIESSLVNA